MKFAPSLPGLEGFVCGPMLQACIFTLVQVRAALVKQCIQVPNTSTIGGRGRRGCNAALNLKGGVQPFQSAEQSKTGALPGPSGQSFKFLSWCFYCERTAGDLFILNRQKIQNARMTHPWCERMQGLKGERLAG